MDQRRFLSKKRKSKHEAKSQHEFVLRKGQEYKVFSHETPNFFRLLAFTGATQLLVWTGVVISSIFGLGGPVLPTWMCVLGTPMSVGLFAMVRWHATHHVAGMTVIPDLADQLILTTHTMTGGLQDRRLLLYQIDISDSSARPGKYRQIQVRGETFNYVIDTDGTIVDPKVFDLVMMNKALPKE